MAVGGGQLPVRPGQPGEEGARGRLYGGSSIFLGTQRVPFHLGVSINGVPSSWMVDGKSEQTMDDLGVPP